MKAFIQKLIDLYAANGKFHALVVTLEYALVGFVTTYEGGLPTSKSAWASFAAALVGVLVGATKGWLRNNLVTK